MLGQLFAPILAPVVQELQNEINLGHQELPLSPADVVEAVIKNVQHRIDSDQEFRMSGLSPDRYQTLIDAAGEPPGLETLLEWARREIIPWSGEGAESVSLQQGVRESRLKDKWNAPIEAARTAPLTPGEAVAAAVRGNLAMAVAAKQAYFSGVSAEDFQTMVHNAGRPPSPGELATLLKRGLIPLEGTGPDAVTFQQGIYEGDSKDKWWRLFADLADYIPPPRTVTALLKEGVLSEEAALKYFEAAGLTPELAKVYIAAASAQHKATTHELTKGEVVQLYTDGLLSLAQAEADLLKLGLNAADAKGLLEHPQASRERQLLTRLVNRFHTLYVAHKISEQDVVDGLGKAGVATDEYTHLLKLWAIERELPVEHITAGEVAGAYHYGVVDAQTAMQLLESLGYHAWEAWLQLSVRNHGPLAEVPEPPRPPLAG